MNPKVSIVIPAYNCGALIERCVKSILNQTFSDLEVIIVNDGSKDDTAKKCDNLAAQDSRVRVIHNRNKGVSNARNTGINNANGRYIQFVDADDCIKPEMTEMLVDAMEHEDADLVICGYYKFQDGKMKKIAKGNFTYELKNDPATHFFDLYNSWLINMPGNKLYKKNLIKKKFNEGMSLGEDLIFNLDYMLGVNKISVMDYCGYEYLFINGESLAGKFNPNKLETSKFLHKRIVDFALNYLKAKESEIKDYAFLQEVRFCISNLMRTDYTKPEKMNYIRRWCSDAMVKEGYKHAGFIGFADYILGRFIIYEQYEAIYAIMSILIKMD